MAEIKKATAKVIAKEADKVVKAAEPAVKEEPKKAEVKAEVKEAPAKKPAAAEGYDFASTEDVAIDAQGIVTINMVEKQAPQVEVQVKYVLVDYGTPTEMNATDSKLNGAKLKVSVAAGTTKIDTADLLPATSALAICDAAHMPTTEGLVNGAVDNGIATVYVYEK